MGTDNLFHKRKARATEEIKKRQARRAPYAKVLIVCEGSKTEPNYFCELRDYYKLEGTNVVISGDCGSAPVSVFEAARERYVRHRNAGDSFDRVYCVFDRDTHDSYERARTAIDRATPKGTFYATTSVPCFEYWLILHFNYTTQPFAPLPGNSPGNQVLGELRNFIPDYEKGSEGLFEKLIDQLDFAINNARRGLRHDTAAGTDNPSTRVHELVEYLQNLNL